MALKVLAEKGATSIVEIGMAGEQKNKFTIAIEKADLIDALKVILMEPDMREHASGVVNLDRMRDGIRVAAGNGNFVLPYTHIFGIVAGGNNV